MLLEGPYNKSLGGVYEQKKIKRLNAHQHSFSWLDVGECTVR